VSAVRPDRLNPAVAMMQRRIEALGLNLQGRTVLTEAATGPYVVTALLAAMAGAEVYAYAADNRHSSAAQALAELDACWDDPALTHLQSMVHPIPDLHPDVIRRANVITNSGNLRPLDRHKMAFAADDTVVPLMFESWEWRGDDLDIDYLRSRNIRVVATNERHPDVDVFGYLGEMAVQLAHRAGKALHNNRVVVVTNNPFGPYLVRTLSSLAAGTGVIDLGENRGAYAGLDVQWLGDFPRIDDLGVFRDSVAVVVALYPFEQEWISESGPLHPAAVAGAFDVPVVLRFAGHLDVSSLDRHGIEFYPQQVAPGHMGILPSALGWDPIIRLQAAGLRAAQAVLEGDLMVGGLPIGDLL